jgi:hypothetical protein
MGSVYIGDHASTSKKKTLMANFGRINVADPQARIQNTTAQWNSTSAITSISLFNIGTYTTGSTVTLYGVKN